MAYPGKTDRESILATALEQVERGGIESLAIRAIATKLGLAPNALYRYFENLEALQAAVAEEARRQMLEPMQAAASKKEPADSIRAMAEVYLQFAQEHPHLFAVYLKTYGQRSRYQSIRNTAFFLEEVSKIYGEDRAVEATHALWGLVYGLATIMNAGLVPPKTTLSTMRFGVDLWLKGAQDSGSSKTARKRAAKASPRSTRGKRA